MADTTATLADKQQAINELLSEAERLARYLRLASDGHLTLGVLDNDELREANRAGRPRGACLYPSWQAAYEAAGRLLAAGHPEPAEPAETAARLGR